MTLGFAVISTSDLTGELDTKWEDWNNCGVVKEGENKGQLSDAAAAANCPEDKNEYEKEYNKLFSKYETSKQISNEYKNLSERALMRPINISFGITLLLYYIYDLTFN